MLLGLESHCSIQCSRVVPICLFDLSSGWISSLNRAVVLMRAMVIGKTATMYEELFTFYFRAAETHGLTAPSRTPRTGGTLADPSDSVAHPLAVAPLPAAAPSMTTTPAVEAALPASDALPVAAAPPAVVAPLPARNTLVSEARSVEGAPFLLAVSPQAAAPPQAAIPPGGASPAAGGRAPTTGAVSQPTRRRTGFVAMLLDFETAEHHGALKAMANVFGGSAASYQGRIIGCRVHFIGFLLKKCGNNSRDPFFRSILALRDVPPEGGMPAVEAALKTIMERSRAAGELKQAAVLRWLLTNDAARLAAFPLSAGALTRTEVLAAGETTNAAESLNKQTQVEVRQHGAPTLLGAIQALMDFDSSIMDQVCPSGQASTVGGSSDQARQRRSLQRRQRNAVPPGGAPPKAKRIRRASKGRSGVAATTPESAGQTGQAAAVVPNTDSAAAVIAVAAAQRVLADAQRLLPQSVASWHPHLSGAAPFGFIGPWYPSGLQPPFGAWAPSRPGPSLP